MDDQNPSTHPNTGQTNNDETDTALRLLSAGIPLTLLFDLAAPVRSAEVYQDEPGHADWLHAAAS